MKHLIRYLASGLLIIGLCYAVHLYVSIRIEECKLEQKELKNLAALIKNPNLQDAELLHFDGPNSWNTRGNSTHFILFSEYLTIDFSNAHSRVEREVTNDFGASQREILNKKLHREIGPLQGVVTDYRYDIEGHQINVIVAQTKDGFYLDVDDYR